MRLIEAKATCDICQKEARFDAKTKCGVWAFMCKSCFLKHGIGLGLGIGQMLIKREESNDCTG
jgi:hypothetical protein